MAASAPTCSSGFGWLAVPLLAVSVGAARPGSWASAHLFIAALAWAVLTCGIAAVDPAARHCGGDGGDAVCTRRNGGRGADVAAGTGAVAGHVHAGRAAAAADAWPRRSRCGSARIRPPYFGSITGRDLFRRSAGLPVDAVSPVDGGRRRRGAEPATPRRAARRSRRRRGGPTAC